MAHAACLCFVLAPGQNLFFHELVSVMRREAEDVGMHTELVVGDVPEHRPGLVPVLVPPHEYFALTPPDRHPEPGRLLGAIFLCAEQPGTWFFDEDARLAHLHGAAVLDINRAGVRAFAEAGLPAEHLPVGWSPHWGAVGDVFAPRPERDVDVLHLGVWSGRRAALLASCAPALAPVRARLLLSDPDAPAATAGPSYVDGPEKWELLRRSRILLNIHAGDRPYFEWLRVVQAISSGVAVVTEHARDMLPLEPGQHLLAGRADRLPILLAGLLEDEAGRAAMARRAHDHLREVLPMRASAERLVAIAQDRARVEPTNRQAGGAGVPPESAARAQPSPVRRFPSSIESTELSVTRAAMKDIRLQLLRQQRALDAMAAPSTAVERVARTGSWDAVQPRVTVIVPMYGEAKTVGRALDSVLRQSVLDVEVVVVDDGSTDGSSEAVARWAREHDSVPLTLLRHPVNRGLGPARNTAVDLARAPLVFMLDADNALYRHTLERLKRRLGEDPDAAFAYGMLAMERNGEPVGLRSWSPWDPARLGLGNRIDAMALWRASALRSLGGYTDDIRLHGWEDYDLLCRLAEQGGHGAFVPEIVASYEARAHSMLALTDISTREAVSVLIERYPTVFRDVVPPL